MDRSIAVVDIGKTNKKVIIFNQDYEVLYEDGDSFQEITDEDGDPCEDLKKLTKWFNQIVNYCLENWPVSAVNIATYGASFVHLDKRGIPVTPLYNYLKPVPEDLKTDFYQKYGPVDRLSTTTASPSLGFLNSGLQLFWLKNYKPEVYKKIKVSLHLPQYFSYLLTGKFLSDITSIGCHTMLYDFNKMNYHEWVTKEKLDQKLAPLVNSDETIAIEKDGRKIHCGPGIHDSSSALVPFLKLMDKKFVILSTGTWSIALNPFDSSLLSEDDLVKDCLSYLSYQGVPVKASRFFLGYHHEKEVKRIASHFNVSDEFYKTLTPGKNDLENLENSNACKVYYRPGWFYLYRKKPDTEAGGDPSQFDNPRDAYMCMMTNLVIFQKQALDLVLSQDIRDIVITGGFANNSVYVKFIDHVYSNKRVYITNINRATAFGAALVIHEKRNDKELSDSLLNTNMVS